MQGSRVAFCQKGTDAMNSKRLIRPMVASDPSVLASAQRMYVLRGYVPDALGITCSTHQRVHGGEAVRADDDLVLWLTKIRAVPRPETA